MVQRFLALLGRLDKDRQVLLYLFLTDVFLQVPGAQRVFHLRILGGVLRRNHPVFKVHLILVIHRHASPPFHRFFPNSFSAKRMSSSVGRLLSNFATTEAASVGV